jgi:hypothetical protein
MKYLLLFPRADSLYGHKIVDWMFGERPKDYEYEQVWEGEVHPAPGASVESTLGFIWQRHNVGDEGDENRPRAREIRSMCSGDIVLINGEVWATADIGFEQLSGEDVPRTVLALMLRS